MKLASLVGKYIDTVSVPSLEIKEFSYTLFSKMTAEEVEQVVTMFGETMDKEESFLILFCTHGMMKNNLPELFDAYKQIGLETNGN